MHFKCRNNKYPFGNVQRLFTAEESVPWEICLKDYNPPEYNSSSLKNKPWADLEIGTAFIILQEMLVNK